MMDFFEEAKISPKNKLMMCRFKFYQYLNSRFDYIEEILRKQEKNYHKPVLNMLKTLFKGVEVLEQKEPLLLEKRTGSLQERSGTNRKIPFRRKNLILLKNPKNSNTRNFCRCWINLKGSSLHLGSPIIELISMEQN